MTTVDAVRALSGDVSARALETELARCVPEDLIRRLGRTGAFRLFVPRDLGGSECDPLSAFTVIEELSRADGSTGWTTMILNTTLFACWLDPGVAREMIATDTELGMAGLFSPVGRTEPADDGAVRLTGRFPFNSGSPFATWFCEGAMVAGRDGTPEWRFLFVPAAEVEILDTWRVAGLRGTASHDVSIDGAIVPPEHSTNPIFARADRAEPHFRWSFFALLAALISGFPLGIARRSLDEFSTLAQRKSRGSSEPLASEQVVQVEIARCEGTLRAARSLLIECLASAWETALAGDEISRDQRIAIRLACLNAMRASLDAVDTTFSLAGGGALYDESPLQRCWRDLHAGRSHLFFSNSVWSTLGKLLLDQPAEKWLV